MKNFKIIIVFNISLLFLSLQSIACGNMYHQVTNVLGEINMTEGRIAHGFKNGFDKQSLLEEQREIIDKIANKEATYKDISDWSLIELKIGDRKNAVKVLDSLYQLYPNEYNIVANLGTGYELIGDNENALKFIQKAVEINPESHYESEWIHVAILKQKLKKQPNYSSILNLHFEDLATIHKTLNEEEKIKLEKLSRALYYQLNERISFIAPEDKCIGQLLYDIAELVSILNSLDHAKLVYELSLTYDPSLSKKINNRITEINYKIYWSRVKDSVPQIVIFIFCIVIFILLKKLVLKYENINFKIIALTHLLSILMYFPLVKFFKLYFYTEDGSEIKTILFFFTLSSLSYFAYFKRSKYTLLYILQISQMLIIALIIYDNYVEINDFLFIEFLERNYETVIQLLSIFILHIYLRYCVYQKQLMK